MRWVTYLSPSGGGQRPGVVDDGDVFGYPGAESLADLLGGGVEGLRAAHAQAVATPVEIIVELETRMCAPLRPKTPVSVVTLDQRRVSVSPARIGGPDDGIPLLDGPGDSSYSAAPGVVDFYTHGQHVGRSLACLWSVGGEHALTFGGILASADDLPTGGEITVELESSHQSAELPPVADAGTDTVLVRSLFGPQQLERGEEIFVGGEPLGGFEIRVGAVA